MLNSGFLGEINGCVSTGKEANVYHATGAGGADLAVKVYKTSILAFKDRDRRARPRQTGSLRRGMHRQRGGLRSLAEWAASGMLW
jgi:serine/threonine-protein kinase RIO1